MKDVLILGAGFGGLELAARLSGHAHVTLIDRSEAFVFGFSKLEVMLGRATAEEVQLRYRGVRRETVTSIDPRTRHVETDLGSYDPDVLVVALGAEYEPAATPGFVEDGHDFYSVSGAERLREALRSFDGGRIVVAVLSVPFKCPPAPYEGALLMHEFLTERSVGVEMTVISPMPSPIPVSVDTSEAIVGQLRKRGIGYLPGNRVRSLDPLAHVAHTKDEAFPYDLFVGVPAHRLPEVVQASGLTEGGTDGWVHVDPRSLATPYDGVYALGDCADAPVPRAGVFAESAAATVAAQILGEQLPYDGTGSCYIEMGGGLVGKVEADFLSGPAPVAPFFGPSLALAREKAAFAAERRVRWFGLSG